jgi:hypothetical protein
MQDYFGEKSPQVEPGLLIAFGVEISSRHSRADELIELLRFAERIADRKVSQYVKKAFYDSKGNLCSLELDPSVQEGDAVASEILDAATEFISQFDWFGMPTHGGEIAKSYAAT